MPFDHSTSSSASGSLGVFRALAALLAALVLVQAALAGQFLFGEEGARGIHRLIGISLSVVAVVVFAQGWRVRRTNSASFLLSLLLLGLVIAATGLGFAGRKEASVAALHIPVAVATFGVAVAATVLDRPRASYR